MSSTNGSTNLVNSEDNTKYIETLDASASGYTESSFTANKWGYKKNSGNYFPFVSGSLISSSNGPVNNDATSLTFGAKVDYLAKAGTYELGFNFKVLPITTTTYMQNLSSNVCTTDPTVVLDERDEKAYTITRLADGKCWMTSNLRYVGDTGSTSSSMIMKAATSNISADQNLTIGDLTSGDDYNNALIHNSGDPTNGVWYNYAAASAGTVVGTQDNTIATHDVCPKGWKLPTIDDYTNLINTGDSKTSFNPVNAGIWKGGNEHSGGHWWAANAQGNIERWFLYNNTPLDLGYFSRVFGISVRCVLAEEPSNISEITTMQQFGSLSNSAKASVLSTMTTDAAYSLDDTRDNQTYTVKKLGDGNVWMTRNLAIGCNGSSSTYGTTITSRALDNTNSNVANTSTTPWNTPITSLTAGASYTESRMACSDTKGAYYNFVAASAGTITNNNTAAVYDICPKGWKLPTKDEFSGITSYKGAFEPLTGGYYYNGEIANTNYGRWWASTGATSTEYRDVLQLLNTDNFGTNLAAGSDGDYVRCILK